ncbi:MAG: LamG-like jellyroll fold domain-containing protein [Planctomycetota bacterium]|jgi:hypothetical protein
MRNLLKVTMGIALLILLLAVSAFPVSAGLVMDFDLRQGSGTTITDSQSSVVGTLNGTVWTTDDQGRDVLRFDNPIDYQFHGGDSMSIPDNAFLDSANFTAELWLYPMATGYYTHFMERIRDGGTFQTQFTLFFRTDNYTTGTWPRFSVLDTSLNDYYAESPDALSLDQWHHIVGVKDTDEIRLYVNGYLKDSTPMTVARLTGSNPLYLGHAPTSNHYYNGYQSRFRFYDHGLSDAEVLSAYQESVPIPGAVWLLGSGLIGLFGIRRKFKG